METNQWDCLCTVAGEPEITFVLTRENEQLRVALKALAVEHCNLREQTLCELLVQITDMTEEEARAFCAMLFAPPETPCVPHDVLCE